MGLPWLLSGKEFACQCRRCRFDPCFRKILWRRKWQPTLVFLPAESHRQRSLAGYSPWGCKEWLNSSSNSLAHSKISKFSKPPSGCGSRHSLPLNLVSVTAWPIVCDVNSLVVQWLRLHVPVQIDVGLIPGRGTKIAHALLQKNKEKTEKI